MSKTARRTFRLDAIGYGILRLSLGRKFGWSAFALSTIVGLLQWRNYEHQPPFGLSSEGVDTLGLWTLLASAGCAITAFVLATIPTWRAGSLEVEGSTVVLRGPSTRVIPLASVTGAWLGPLINGPGFTMQLASGDRVSVHTRDEDMARATMDAAGLGPGQSTATFRKRGPMWRSLLAGSIASAWFGPWIAQLFASPRTQFYQGTLEPWMKWVVFFAVVMLLRRARKVVVGVDGVSVDGFLGRRFVPYVHVERVSGEKHHVRLHLYNGSTVHLPVGDDCAVVGQRIVDAMASAPGPGGAGAAVALDRGGRTLAQWRDDLRVLLAREGGFRETRASRDEVTRVLEDPECSPERRVAAALALSGSASAEDRERVRVAAGSSALAPMRVALERALEGEIDDAALEKAAAASVPLRMTR